MSGQCILCAEDEVHLRLLIRFMLRQQGYFVVEAFSGVQAVEVAVKEHPSLILVDLNIQQTTGLEATQRIRQIPAIARTPIIGLIASMEDAQNNDELYSMVFDDVITKPFE